MASLISDPESTIAGARFGARPRGAYTEDDKGHKIYDSGLMADKNGNPIGTGRRTGRHSYSEQFTSSLPSPSQGSAASHDEQAKKDYIKTMTAISQLMEKAGATTDPGKKQGYTDAAQHLSGMWHQVYQGSQFEEQVSRGTNVPAGPQELATAQNTNYDGTIVGGAERANAITNPPLSAHPSDLEVAANQVRRGGTPEFKYSPETDPARTIDMQVMNKDGSPYISPVPAQFQQQLKREANPDFLKQVEGLRDAGHQQTGAQEAIAQREREKNRLIVQQEVDRLTGERNNRTRNITDPAQKKQIEDSYNERIGAFRSLSPADSGALPPASVPSPTQGIISPPPVQDHRPLSADNIVTTMNDSGSPLDSTSSHGLAASAPTISAPPQMPAAPQVAPQMPTAPAPPIAPMAPTLAAAAPVGPAAGAPDKAAWVKAYADKWGIHPQDAEMEYHRKFGGSPDDQTTDDTAAPPDAGGGLVPSDVAAAPAAE